MEKKTNSTYLLILIIGFVFISSFFELKVGEFDWKYFLIVMLYIIVSTVCQYFIVEAFTNRDKTVISSRLLLNDTFDEFEVKNLWDKYKELSLNDQKILHFYRAFCIYRFKDGSLAEKRKGSVLLKENFKEAFLEKRLLPLLKMERMSFGKRRKIIKLQNEQDDISYIDEQRLKFKRGYYLGKKSSTYFVALVSFIVQFTSLVLAIFSIFKFSIQLDVFLISKLSIVGLLLIADIYATCTSIRREIKFWNEYSSDIKTILRILEGKEQNEIEKSLAYHVFYNKSYK